MCISQLQLMVDIFYLLRYHVWARDVMIHRSTSIHRFNDESIQIETINLISVHVMIINICYQVALCSVFFINGTYHLSFVYLVRFDMNGSDYVQTNTGYCLTLIASSWFKSKSFCGRAFVIMDVIFYGYIVGKNQNWHLAFGGVIKERSKQQQTHMKGQCLLTCSLHA